MTDDEEIPTDPKEMGEYFADENFWGALDDLLDEYRDDLHRVLEDHNIALSDEDWGIALRSYDDKISAMHAKVHELFNPPL